MDKKTQTTHIQAVLFIRRNSNLEKCKHDLERGLAGLLRIWISLGEPSPWTTFLSLFLCSHCKLTELNHSHIAALLLWYRGKNIWQAFQSKCFRWNDDSRGAECQDWGKCVLCCAEKVFWKKC